MSLSHNINRLAVIWILTIVIWHCIVHAQSDDSEDLDDDDEYEYEDDEEDDVIEKSPKTSGNVADIDKQMDLNPSLEKPKSDEIAEDPIDVPASTEEEEEYDDDEVDDDDDDIKNDVVVEQPIAVPKTLDDTSESEGLGKEDSTKLNDDENEEEEKETDSAKEDNPLDGDSAEVKDNGAKEDRNTPATSSETKIMDNNEILAKEATDKINKDIQQDVDDEDEYEDEDEEDASPGNDHIKELKKDEPKEDNEKFESSNGANEKVNVETDKVDSENDLQIKKQPTAVKDGVEQTNGNDPSDEIDNNESKKAVDLVSDGIVKEESTISKKIETNDKIVHQEEDDEDEWEYEEDENEQKAPTQKKEDSDCHRGTKGTAKGDDCQGDKVLNESEPPNKDKSEETIDKPKNAENTKDQIKEIKKRKSMLTVVLDNCHVYCRALIPFKLTCHVKICDYVVIFNYITPSAWKLQCKQRDVKHLPIAHDTSTKEEVRIYEEAHTKSKTSQASSDERAMQFLEKIQKLENHILHLENSLLMDRLSTTKDATEYSYLENHILKIENELLKVNATLSLIKTENEALIKNQNAHEKDLAIKSDRQGGLSDSALAQMLQAHESRVNDMSSKLQIYVDNIKVVESRTKHLEEENRLLVERLLSQSMLMHEVLRKLDNITAEQFEQNQKIMDISQTKKSKKINDDFDTEKEVTRMIETGPRTIKSKEGLNEVGRDERASTVEDNRMTQETGADKTGSSTQEDKIPDIPQHDEDKSLEDKESDVEPKKNKKKKKKKKKKVIQAEEDKIDSDPKKVEAEEKPKKKEHKIKKEEHDANETGDDKKDAPIGNSENSKNQEDESDKNNKLQNDNDEPKKIKKKKKKKKIEEQPIEQTKEVAQEKKKKKKKKKQKKEAPKLNTLNAQNVADEEDKKAKVKDESENIKVRSINPHAEKEKKERERKMMEAMVEKAMFLKTHLPDGRPRPKFYKDDAKSPKDCYDHYIKGRKRDMPMKINLMALEKPIEVFCDMKNGGWTLIQRRMDGSMDFFKGWQEYKEGFGSPVGEYWLGNDNIHYLTHQWNYTLRIDLMDWNRKKAWAEYEFFSVGDEDSGYQLKVSGYSGDAGDSMLKHDGMKFSTKDRDNDLVAKDFGGSCAIRFTGAWWYYKCYKSNLNGKYYKGGKVAEKLFDGVAWKSWSGSEVSLKRVEIKVKPHPS